MPGTVRLEFWNMSLADALAVLAADQTVLLAQMSDAADVAELRRAATAVIEAHVADVTERYATRSAIEPFLKLLISNCNQRGDD